MGAGVLLDKGDVGRTARGSFKAEDAGTGKEVEAGKAVKSLPKPIEQGFPYAVGRRPESGDVGDVNEP